MDYIEEMKFFCNESVETLEPVAQSGGRCPIPGNLQRQVGLGSKQPELSEDFPAHCRGIGSDDL